MGGNICASRVWKGEENGSYLSFYSTLFNKVLFLFPVTHFAFSDSIFTTTFTQNETFAFATRLLRFARNDSGSGELTAMNIAYKEERYEQNEGLEKA
jgi:hypothetical protein